VYKTGVTHYFNIGKAKRELGYCPTVQNDMNGVLKWFLERGYHVNAERNARLNLRISSVCFLLLLLVLLFSSLPVAG